MSLPQRGAPAPELTEDPAITVSLHCTVSPLGRFPLSVISLILVCHLSQCPSLLLGWTLHGGKNPSALFARCTQQRRLGASHWMMGKGSSRAWTTACGGRPFSRLHESKCHSGPLTGSTPDLPEAAPRMWALGPSCWLVSLVSPFPAASWAGHRGEPVSPPHGNQP